jgi:hypothetical protein
MAGAAGAGVEVDINLLKRIERMESRLNLDEDQRKVESYVEGDRLQARIVKDEKTKEINVEDTLLQYMELMIALNAKLNNHVSSTKLSVRELEQKFNLYHNIQGAIEHEGG